MRSDSEIERDVKEELQWDPDLDATDIAVSVKKGVVTLTGFVRSYTDKYEAEAAAKRVAGVAGVANDIEVRMPSVDERPDPEIARDAVAAIKSQLPISSEHIKVVVKNGWVTLEGQVEWQYQRSTAETAVRRIKGVKGVSNLIQLKPRAEPAEIKRKIQEAFKRNAEVDANRIMVETNGGEVDPEGHRALVDRTRRGRASGLVGTGRHQSRRPHHREPVAGAMRAGARSSHRDAASSKRNKEETHESTIAHSVQVTAGLAQPKPSICSVPASRDRSSVRRIHARYGGCSGTGPGQSRSPAST